MSFVLICMIVYLFMYIVIFIILLLLDFLGSTLETFYSKIVHVHVCTRISQLAICMLLQHGNLMALILLIKFTGIISLCYRIIFLHLFFSFLKLKHDGFMYETTNMIIWWCETFLN